MCRKSCPPGVLEEARPIGLRRILARPSPASGALACALAVLMLLAPAGCQLFQEEPIELDIRAKINPFGEFTAVRRVLILPFANETAYPNQTHLVESSMAQALNELGLFDVVSLSAEEARVFGPLDQISRGRIPLTLLVELGRSYKVDAVLLGCLKMYNPYPPPLISLKVHMIAVDDGKVLRTLSGILDAGNDQVIQDMVRYHETSRSLNDSLFSWRRIMESPKMYTQYACHRFVSAMYPDA